MDEDNVKRLVGECDIRADVAVGAQNPDWSHPHNSWKVTLRMNGRRMTVPFFTGLTGEPTACDVLECLASDAASYDNTNSFEDWAGEFGFDTDSRKAERIYNQTATQTRKLRRFLADQYDELVYGDANVTVE
jgi:hypothetical protein